MSKTRLKAIAAAMLIAAGVLAVPAPAEAGRGHAVGAGLIGFGVGAVVGSALTPREVYVVPPPPPPAYYAPAAYGPLPWSPAWYDYCAAQYRSFNAQTGYYTGHDGYPHFCR